MTRTSMLLAITLLVISCTNLPKDSRHPYGDAHETGPLALDPFFYPGTDKAVLFVKFAAILPISESATVVAELASMKTDKVLQSRKLNPHVDDRDESKEDTQDEVEFSLKGLEPGRYELRTVLHDEIGERIQRIAFQYPLTPPAPVISPKTKTVSALPEPITPPPYKLEVKPGGGMAVTIGNRTFKVESSYSYPHGGKNRLLASTPDQKGEKSWSVKTEKLNDCTYEVKADGEYYSITRRIKIEPTRVMIHDTIGNKSDDVVGIILSNHLNIQSNPKLQAKMMQKFTAFVHATDCGVGIIALDDLYQIQEHSRFENGLAELRTDDFGLGRGASYTLQWAIYPTASNDYYDFISQIRKDEGINRRIDGAFNFTGSVQEQARRTVPSKEYIDLKNLAYLSLNCLSFPKDDPSISLEGIEFIEYPKESAAIKKTISQINAVDPNVKVMFHVAHGLYACNNPEQRFPDSRVIRSDGQPIHYYGAMEGAPKGWVERYSGYFSQQRLDEGWRWWIFYPTMENSFGKAMIEAMDYMINELGATGMWADGFISGYAQVQDNDDGYSYDRWDGHSVDIDPETKLVTRKKTCVAWVSLPVLKKVVQMIAAKDGVTIINEGPLFPDSRTFWNEEIITSCEGRPEALIGIHLGRAPAPLGHRGASMRDKYQDMLRTLEYGCLYFWWTYKPLTNDYKTLVEHMYPITIESIHAGTIRGKDRVITKKSGVYGWHEDRSLHKVYRYDARGALFDNRFLTTIDHSSVRTEVALEKDQSAVVVKLPIVLAASSPVNVNVRQYDTKTIQMELNGRGKVTLRIANGQFEVKSGATYRIETGNHSRRIDADATGTVAFQLNLTGAMNLAIMAQ